MCRNDDFFSRNTNDAKQLEKEKVRKEGLDKFLSKWVPNDNNSAPLKTFCN